MTKSRTPPAWRRAFLRELARTGNITTSARSCGLDPSFVHQTRRRNAAFAASWERALATAREKLSDCAPAEAKPTRRVNAGASVGNRVANPTETPACPLGSLSRAAGLPAGRGAGDREGAKARKRPILRPDEIVRSSRAGKPRIIRVREGKWSARKEAAFLAELTATANVSAAARAAGVSLPCVYMRRKLWPAFKAEWEAAVAEGFARIETLVVCAATTTLNPEPLPERAWEEPRMTMDQAMKVWLTHRAGGPGARKRRLGGVARREPDIEEVRREILRKVAAMERAERA